MIDPNTEQKILDAIDIADVIGEFVALSRRGQNYVGLCPFHDDKSPSLYVNTARGIYKCFACGAGGDAITFLKEHKHMTYGEVLYWLADRYNIEIPKTRKQSAHDKVIGALLSVNKTVMEYYESCLQSGDDGIGMAYFKKLLRVCGVKEEVLREGFDEMLD